MRLLKNPTTKIGRKKKKQTTTHPTVSFPMFTVYKKGINPSDSRREAGGWGEKLKYFRQPGSPGGGKEEGRDMGWSPG